jgi:D-beta-D-heptose 7-phosphate kinase/D-beta-D-heptose 1-phosphate adenosyltransferase
VEIERIIKGFVEKKVVVIGDVMVDEYIQGKVSRLSPESSVPLLLRPGIPSLDADLIRLGGAGNTARNIASLGADVVLIGVCGEDDFAGRQLMSLVANHAPTPVGGSAAADQSKVSQPKKNHRLQIDCRIVRQLGLSTTHKLRLINAQSVQLFRVDTEIKQELDGATRERVLDEFRGVCGWADIVVVTDYAKGFITKELFAKLREIAREKRIVVDPKEPASSSRFDKYQGADIIIPNEGELKNSFDFKGRLEDLFKGELQRVMSHKSIGGVICTRGAQGVLFSDAKTDEGVAVVGRDVEVADVTGASDTVTATVALSYAQVEDLAIAARLAETAGRLKVTKRLTGTVQIAELLDMVDPMIRRRARTKLHLERPDFLSSCERAKNKHGPQSRLAFITGCFDILHRGHLRLIEHAAEKADVVAVAVNSDDYIRRSDHKTGGPYLDEISRATLIASLANVDAVTVFDDETPELLISELRPSLLVMGEEYRQRYLDKDLPGKHQIAKLGIEVDCVGWDEVRSESSSAIAAKIRAGIGPRDA